MIGITHNGITIKIENWNPIRKKPVLAVSFEGEPTHYKVASFNDEETARWYGEILDEFFSGLVDKDDRPKQISADFAKLMTEGEMKVRCL